MQEIDKRKVQRLVDGELSIEETRLLLADIDRRIALGANSGNDAAGNPWRAIAGAFIEDQIIRQQFLDQDDVERLVVPNSAMVERDSISLPVARPGASWIALAASLVLAFCVGLILTGTFGDGDDWNPIEHSKRVQTPVVAGQGAEVDDLNQEPAVYQMQVEDPSGTQYWDAGVPLYSSHQNEAAKWLQNVDLPQSLRAEAAESGYQVEQNVRYLSGRFKDGRTFVIPVRKFSFQSEQ